jgi:hypothetical protein
MSEHRTPIATVHIGAVSSFIAEMRNDAERIRHREVRWTTETATPTDAEPSSQGDRWRFIHRRDGVRVRAD